MQACQISLYADIPLGSGHDPSLVLFHFTLAQVLNSSIFWSFFFFFLLLSEIVTKRRDHTGRVWLTGSPQRKLQFWGSSPQGSSMRSGFRLGELAPLAFPDLCGHCPSACEMTNRGSSGLRRPHPPPQPWALLPSPHVALHSKVCFFAFESSACRILLCPFHLWSMLYLRIPLRLRMPFWPKWPYFSCWVHITATEETCRGSLATCQACVFLGSMNSGNLWMVGYMTFLRKELVPIFGTLKRMVPATTNFVYRLPRVIHRLWSKFW